MSRSNPHRTLLILKPDGYKRNLLGAVLLRLDCARVVRIETRRLKNKDVHFLYGRYKGRSFYAANRRFIISGPSIVMELVGHNAVGRVRELVGYGSYPYPLHTIRGFYATAHMHNVVHCSDSAAMATAELAYFFSKGL